MSGGLSSGGTSLASGFPPFGNQHRRAFRPHVFHDLQASCLELAGGNRFHNGHFVITIVMLRRGVAMAQLL
jgi:hypothetical protein